MGVSSLENYATFRRKSSILLPSAIIIIFTKKNVEVVNCINLFTREDRMLSASKQSKEQGFAIKFYEGIRDKVIRRGINKIHRKIVQDAKDNGLDYVIVMEDDCLFSSPDSFNYYIENMPKDFHLYMGMIYAGEIKEGRIMNGFSGLTLYTVHNSFYDEFLAADPNDHLDRYLGNSAFKNNYYVCEPFVCYQSGGYSDNQRQQMDYKVYHEQMKFYGR